jgi:DNA polymerase-3 subunit alpha
MLRAGDMVKFAADNGGAIAVTDHGWLGGAAKFAYLAKEGGIKPIIGCETYIVDDSSQKTAERREWWHLILLARNVDGYQNLCRLTSLAHINGFYYKPRIDHRLLKAHKEGLIVLSGCIGSEIPQLFLSGNEKGAVRRIQWYQEVFGDSYFIEIQDHAGVVTHEAVVDGGKMLFAEHDLNTWLVDQAKRHGIGIVATNDAHYLQRQHGEVHDTMLAMQMGSWKSAPDRMRFPGAPEGKFEFFLKNEKEMRALSKEKWWQSAISTTKIVADSIDPSVVPFGSLRLPKFEIPTDDPEFKTWLKLKKLTLT